jgi:RNA polymerase sigma-70 factor, ECF subfamily
METLAELLDEREHLLEIARWRFGSADRVVQETYRRWYALDPVERAHIADPRAWLARVASTICLDGLDPDVVDPLVSRFALACTTGDVLALRATLADDATVITDSGGNLRTSPHPVRGADQVATYLSTLLTRRPGTHLTPEPVNGHAGLVLRHQTQAIAVITLTTISARISTIYLVLNPSKLTPWHAS